MRKYLFLLFITLLVKPQFAYAEIYVVAVGINDYQDINNLRLCENDAKTIAKIYKTRTNNVITITGKHATRSIIIQALNDQFARAEATDMVVFFFSGHGYEGGFCPYDMKSGNMNGLSYENIYTILRKCKAKQKIIMADACMSGGLRKEKKQSDAIQKLDSNVILFLSSRTKETSIENPTMTNGYFTSFLERGLRGGADTNRDKRISAKEIYTFVSNGVKNKSKNKQHPVMWGHFKDDFTLIDWNQQTSLR